VNWSEKEALESLKVQMMEILERKIEVRCKMRKKKKTVGFKVLAT